MADKDDKVSRTEQEWQHCLTPEQYRVLRKHGTERAFTGEYHDSKEPGVYRCAGCGTALFSSETKFDSGTGWPSFFKPVEQGAVETRTDSSFFMRADRGALRRLRGPSRPRLRRRAGAHGSPLLHQLGRAQARARPGRRQEVS